MRSFAFRVLAFLAFAFSAQVAISQPKAAIRQTIYSDLEGDGKVETIVLDAKREWTLQIWRGNKRLAQDVPRRWQPWKMTVADVDGDRQREIVLGTYKGTRFFPKPHNCLFVYGWDGKILRPKWLGSSLSKPFTDFAFANLDSDNADELLAVETLRDGKKCLVCYSWAGFGFASDWQRGAWKNLKIVSVTPKRVLVEADGKQIAVTK